MAADIKVTQFAENLFLLLEHELLSPVLLNINHYNRCLDSWCEQSNFDFVHQIFPQLLDLGGKIKEIILMGGRLFLRCFDGIFAGFR